MGSERKLTDAGEAQFPSSDQIAKVFPFHNDHEIFTWLTVFIRISALSKKYKCNLLFTQSAWQRISCLPSRRFFDVTVPVILLCIIKTEEYTFMVSQTALV